jgi:hypothetical protein
MPKEKLRAILFIDKDIMTGKRIRCLKSLKLDTNTTFLSPAKQDTRSIRRPDGRNGPSSRVPYSRRARGILDPFMGF